MLVRMWNDRKSYFLMVGLSNGTTTLEDSLAGFFFFFFFTNLNILLSHDPTTMHLNNYPNKSETYVQKKHAETVYRSFLHDSQILEATKMFFRR